MNYPALLRSALVALLRNKLRSLLTVLGITIGIAAVICVVAIGKAGQARVQQQLNKLGDNFVWIEAGGRAVNGVRTGTHDTITLVAADAVAIKNQVSLIKSVSPNVDDPIQVVYGNQNWHTTYRGVSPEFFDIKRRVFEAVSAARNPSALSPASGRFSRVALRQIKMSGEPAPAIDAWLAAHDHAEAAERDEEHP